MPQCKLVPLVREAWVTRYIASTAEDCGMRWLGEHLRAGSPLMGSDTLGKVCDDKGSGLHADLAGGWITLHCHP